MVAVPCGVLLRTSRRKHFLATSVLLLVAFFGESGFVGCSPNTGQQNPAEPDVSIFGNASVPIRAVVVTRGQRPYPLESLEIRGSPASVVAPLLKSAQKEHEQRVAAKLNDIEQTTELLRQENLLLDRKKQEVSDDYNKKIPLREDLPPESSRDDLRAVAKMRAQKSRAVKSFEGDLEVTIRPIEDAIRRLQVECRRLKNELEDIRRSFNTVIFETLPAIPAKRWVTDANGYATASISRAEPWYFWSETSREVPTLGTESYRWILAHPDDLDDAGKLFFDHRTLLDSRGLVVDAETGVLSTRPVIDRPRY